LRHPAPGARIPQRHPEFAATAVVPVNTPDFSGCLESGFALAIEAIIDALVPEYPRSPDGRQPAGQRARVVDADAGRHRGHQGMDRSLRAAPVVLPDIGDSLDGHLIDADHFRR
jgi:nitrogenase molybdenum-iron protein NifN